MSDFDVAYLTNLKGVSGASVHAKRVCRYLEAETDVDVTMVHSSSTALPEYIESSQAGVDTLWAPDLGDGIDRLDPDVVLVHSFNPDLLMELRGQAEVDSRAWVWRHGASVAERWLTLNHWQDSRHVTSLLGNLDWFDAVVCPSEAAAERFQLVYGPDDAPPQWIAPIVIDLEDGGYETTKFMKNGTLRIVLASRIAANNYIIAPLLAARRLEADVSVKVVGWGRDFYTNAVSGVLDTLEAAEMTGHIDHSEVVEYLNWSDVVCIPSYTNQSISNVAAEAMAAGNVVLAGNYETVREESCIVRVQTAHPPSWHTALTDVAEGGDDVLEVIEAGVEAAERYDVAHIAENAYMPLLTMMADEIAGA